MKNAIDEVVEKAPRINQRALRQQLEGWAKSAKPGNWAAKKLEEYGLDGDYTPHDAGNQLEANE